MISHGFLILFTIVSSYTFSITANSDDVIYTKPNLRSTENKTFTDFHLTNGIQVLHVTEDVPFNNFFPKCCPPNYKYERVERKCVQSNDTWQFETKNIDDFYLIKSGLKDCDVIVDYVLLNDDPRSVSGSYKRIQYKNETFESGQFCIDHIENENFILRVCYGPEYCRSGGINCLKKCCPDGEIFLGRKCGPQPEFGFPTENYHDVIVNFTDDFAIFSQKLKCKLYDPNITHENIQIFENGSISILEGDQRKTYDVEDEMYCLEFAYTNDSITPYLLMCTDITDRNDIKYVLSNVVMPLSCICLSATILVYVFYHKLERVIHRIVLCYCIAQFTGFALLTYLQINPDLPQPACSVLAFIVLFGYHAGFSWITVICYDMWRKLGSMSTKVGNKNKLELKRTFYYCMYGWLVPTFITLNCYLENKYSFLPESLHAYIGDRYCFLEVRVKDGNYGYIVFFIIPITCAIIVNIIFFLLTVRYIIEARESVWRMCETKKEEKRLLCALTARAFMVLKLFLVMGINWSFEIISLVISFKGSKIIDFIELLVHTLNCFQGVFIFLIFVVKWKVVKSSMVKFKTIVVSCVNRSTSLVFSWKQNRQSYTVENTNPNLIPLHLNLVPSSRPSGLEANFTEL